MNEKKKLICSVLVYQIEGFKCMYFACRSYCGLQNEVQIQIHFFRKSNADLPYNFWIKKLVVIQYTYTNKNVCLFSVLIREPSGSRADGKF